MTALAITKMTEMAQELDVVGLEKEAFINGNEVGEAATFLEAAKAADIRLRF